LEEREEAMARGSADPWVPEEEAFESMRPQVEQSGSADLDDDCEVKLSYSRCLRRRDYPSTRAFQYAIRWCRFALREGKAYELKPEEAFLSVDEQVVVLEKAGVLVRNVLIDDYSEGEFVARFAGVRTRPKFALNSELRLYRDVLDDELVAYYVKVVGLVSQTSVACRLLSKVSEDFTAHEWVLELVDEWRETRSICDNVCHFAGNGINSLHRFVVEDPLTFDDDVHAAILHPDSQQMDWLGLAKEACAKFKLNELQGDAVRMALKHKLFLIQGPPGTGKSVTASALVYAWSRGEDRILVSAHSNQALNVLGEKIVAQIPREQVCRYVSVEGRNDMRVEQVTLFGSCLFPDAARASAIDDHYDPSANAFSRHVKKYMRELVQAIGRSL
jgi:hypothetical protein